MSDKVIPTPGQTVGPFFGFALPYLRGEELVPHRSPGSLRLHGIVFDGCGVGVPDALIEIWQHDADGKVVSQPGSLRRDGWTFTGWGRCATDTTGQYSFTTVRPGTAHGRPRFFAIAVFARGLTDRLYTRAYLPEDQQALNRDPWFTRLPPDEQSTLVADTDASGYRFDIRLQGELETVFLCHGPS